MISPITPPPELVAQWVAQAWHEGTPVQVAASDLHIATAAARWGADQELEACCEEMKSLPSPFGVPFGAMASNALRAARRPTPKPPSLKEQALARLAELEIGRISYSAGIANIRRALEALPND